MQTANANLTERRHIPDRRTHAAKAKRLGAMDWLAMTLLIVGGLNWGLVGLFNFDLVATLFGEMSAVSRVVYTLVGLSALYSIYTSSKMAARGH